MVTLGLFAMVLSGCSRGNTDGQSSTTKQVGGQATDISGTVGEDIQVGDVVVEVRAFEAAFQPASPPQRLSDETPSAPAAGESFYQAYVRVTNNSANPIRVDPNDFLCMAGNLLAKIEPTRSGPMPRSLIEGTSLDLLLTFKAPSGEDASLLYSPPWYDGIITISQQSEAVNTTTTEG
jgi:hypothetical protein